MPFKTAGLEIFSELHVFQAGETLIEKWQVAGENQQKASLSQRAFTSVSIQKVRIEGNVVSVEIRALTEAGIQETRIRRFDFSSEKLEMRVVADPFL